MNRGRHKNSERSKVIRLARYHGALKPEKNLKNGILL